MSRTGRVVLGAVLLVNLVVITSYSAASFEPPEWAYPSTPRDFKPDTDDGKPKRLAASAKAYTYAQLQDVFAAPDWYPTAHPRMPDVVAKGRRPNVHACASCLVLEAAGLVGETADEGNRDCSLLRGLGVSVFGCGGLGFLRLGECD